MFSVFRRNTDSDKADVCHPENYSVALGKAANDRSPRVNIHYLLSNSHCAGSNCDRTGGVLGELLCGRSENVTDGC